MNQDSVPELPERQETEAERSDRNWNELLQELRVTQIGNQILSGFLLTLPFQPRFAELSPTLFAVFIVAVAAGTLTTLLMVAPVAVHRQFFRWRLKKELVDSAHTLATAGLACLAVTITGVTGLVIGAALGETAGLIALAAAGLGFILLWLVFPVALRRRLTQSR